MSHAVILLHSSAASGRQWQSLAAALSARGHAVHAVDLHGHGATPAWSGASPLTLDDEAALVAPILARHAAVHLVGHSYGAAVAMRVAALHPAKVRSLVAYEPVCFRELFDANLDPTGAESARALSSALDADLAQGATIDAARRFVTFWSGAEAWRTTSEAQRESIARRMPSVGRHFGAVFASRGLVAELARLPLPMLFLSGALSPAVARRIAALLRSRIPAARHATLPAMGHMGPITHASLFDERVLAFIDSLVPASAEAISHDF